MTAIGTCGDDCRAFHRRISGGRGPMGRGYQCAELAVLACDAADLGSNARGGLDGMNEDIDRTLTESMYGDHVNRGDWYKRGPDCLTTNIHEWVLMEPYVSVCRRCGLGELNRTREWKVVYA